MNLIEKLGGYDRAKDHRDYLIDFGNEFNRPNKHEVDSLNDALLEYRRENNIFEVGDFVLAIDPFFGDSIFKIRDVYSRHDGFRIALFEHGGFFRLSALQHATPEEIKTGHRL